MPLAAAAANSKLNRFWIFLTGLMLLTKQVPGRQVKLLPQSYSSIVCPALISTHTDAKTAPNNRRSVYFHVHLYERSLVFPKRGMFDGAVMQTSCPLPYTYRSSRFITSSNREVMPSAHLHGMSKGTLV